MLPYGRQTIEDDDVAAVSAAMRAELLTTGPEIDAFEAELATACGARHAIVVSSGTAALHCAYAAAGLGPGDELVTTPLTFSATANMALALGASVRFADIDDGDLCLDPARVSAGAKTKVIAPVDYAGQPAKIDAFMRIGPCVVEDASHSIGARLSGKPVGSLAHLTTFSFHPVKTITTGEGGAVLTNDATLAQRARDFRNHGLVRDPARLPAGSPKHAYEIQSLGFNYRLTALQCALGRCELKKLPRFVARRAQIVARYRAALDGVVRMQTVREGVDPAWHLFVVRVRDRDRLFAALAGEEIFAQVHYPPVNAMPLYRAHDPRQTPIATRAASELLSLPLFPSLTDADVDRVIAAVKKHAA